MRRTKRTFGNNWELTDAGQPAPDANNLRQYFLSHLTPPALLLWLFGLRSVMTGVVSHRGLSPAVIIIPRFHVRGKLLAQKSKRRWKRRRFRIDRQAHCVRAHLLDLPSCGYCSTQQNLLSPWGGDYQQTPTRPLSPNSFISDVRWRPTSLRILQTTAHSQAYITRLSESAGHSTKVLYCFVTERPIRICWQS